MCDDAVSEGSHLLQYVSDWLVTQELLKYDMMKVIKMIIAITMSFLRGTTNIKRQMIRNKK